MEPGNPLHNNGLALSQPLPTPDQIKSGRRTHFLPGGLVEQTALSDKPKSSRGVTLLHDTALWLKPTPPTPAPAEKFLETPPLPGWNIKTKDIRKSPGTSKQNPTLAEAEAK